MLRGAMRMVRDMSYRTVISEIGAAGDDKTKQGCALALSLVERIVG